MLMEFLEISKSRIPQRLESLDIVGLEDGLIVLMYVNMIYDICVYFEFSILNEYNPSDLKGEILALQYL